MGTEKGSRTPSGREPMNECAGRTVNATPCRMATGLQPCAAAMPRVRGRVTQVTPGPRQLASAHHLVAEDLQDGVGEIAGLGVAAGRRPR